MNAARNELLAGAALAFDQHSARDGSHLLDLHQHLPNRVALPNQSALGIIHFHATGGLIRQITVPTDPAKVK